MAQKIPKEAQDLIIRDIHSVAQLEVLLYLRTLEGKPATASSVARDQRIGVDMAADLLADLVGRKFAVQESEGFIYAPETSVTRQVDALAAAYPTFRVAIINLIFSKPSESVQSFADAFRVRREED